MKTLDLGLEASVFLTDFARRLEKMAIEWQQYGEGAYRAEVRGQTWRIIKNPWGGAKDGTHTLITLGRSGHALDENFPDLETAKRAAEFALLVLDGADQVQPEPNDDENHY